MCCLCKKQYSHNMSTKIDELNAEIAALRMQLKGALDKIKRLSDENRNLSNDNTYLESYSARLNHIVLTNGSITQDEYKHLRKSRHSQ